MATILTWRPVEMPLIDPADPEGTFDKAKEGLDKLQAASDKLNLKNLKGFLVRFETDGGYAYYMVRGMTPLYLQPVPFGNARASDFDIAKLKLEDVKSMFKSERAAKKLLEKQTSKKAKKKIRAKRGK